jgi:hypothetical protein
MGHLRQVGIMARRNRLAALIALLLPLVGGCKHIRTETEINAPPDVVWDVLTELEAYPEWNPYHVRVEGGLDEGRKLEVEVHKPNGNQLTIHPKLQVAKRQRELTWGGGVPGIFTGRHAFVLQPLSGGRTHLVHEESFKGIAVPFAELGSIEEGYQRVNAALARRCEARVGAR